MVEVGIPQGVVLFFVDPYEFRGASMSGTTMPWWAQR